LGGSLCEGEQGVFVAFAEASGLGFGDEAGERVGIQADCIPFEQKGLHQCRPAATENVTDGFTDG
jgi:hypothetical protein